MATTPTTRPRPRSPASSSNGQGKVNAVSIAPPGHRVRGPELVVGLLVTVLFALGAVLWHLNAVDRSPALAVVGSVERGDTISSADIKIIYVSSDDALARLDGSQLSEVVGQVALVDLAPGTMLSRSVVADGPALDAGEGVVGLSLEPGGYPAMGIAPGDRVSVVRTAEPAVDEGGDGGEPSEVVLTRDATVFAVEELASDRLLVSIVAPEDDAEAVAAAAGTGSLRLVLVSP